MPKVQLDLQKFAIISAAFSGIGLLWWIITDVCIDAFISIVENQLFVDSEDAEKKKKIREQIENIYSLFEQLIEDTKKMIKALQDGEAVQDLQELFNKIGEKNKNIILEKEKLDEDFEDVQLENGTIDKIRLIKYYYIPENIKNLKELVKKNARA